MPYYQDTNNQLHFLSDVDIANSGLSLLPSGCTAITDTAAENLQAAQQATAVAAAALLPNPAAFNAAIKTGVGGIIEANTLSVAYPLFFATIEQQNWTDVQALILDAQSKAVITAEQYAAIKAAAASFNIPVILP